jgi:hypothetical protein
MKIGLLAVSDSSSGEVVVDVSDRRYSSPRCRVVSSCFLSVKQRQGYCYGYGVARRMRESCFLISAFATTTLPLASPVLWFRVD